MPLKKDNILKALRPLGDHATYYNQLKYDCPRCTQAGTGIGKKNLEIHSEYLVFHCWACNYKGHISKLIKDYGDTKYLHLFETKKDSILLPLKTAHDFQLPEFLIKPSNPAADPQVLKYLHSRGLTNPIIEQRNIQYCYYGKLKGNIIFPSYDKNNNLIAYVAHNYEKRKYKTFKNKDFVFFYESFVDLDFPIILTEGIYDCLSIPNAIPLLGTTISKKIAETLSNKKIILALDADIDKKVYDINVSLLKHHGCDVFTFPITFGKDINEYYLTNMIFLKQELLKTYEAIQQYSC